MYRVHDAPSDNVIGSLSTFVLGELPLRVGTGWSSMSQPANSGASKLPRRRCYQCPESLVRGIITRPSR
jgi:hypothetical protein